MEQGAARHAAGWLASVAALPSLTADDARLHANAGVYHNISDAHLHYTSIPIHVCAASSANTPGVDTTP